MDGTHKHAIHASHWFILPCLVHIALLLIYLPSSRSHHLTGVYLSCLVSLLVAVHVHVHMCVRSVRPFDICVCVWLHGCQHLRLCERHIVWHDRRWPSLSVLHPLSVMAWRTLLSWWQRWLTASVSQEDRFVWSVFLYYLDSFPRVFAFFYIHLCVCMLVSFPCMGKVDEHALSSSSSTSDCNTCWHPADSPYHRALWSLQDWDDYF